MLELVITVLKWVTAYSCPFRKSSSRIIQIWVPKGTRPPNMD